MRITRLGAGRRRAPAGSTPTPSSARSPCCASTARSWTATASTRVRMTATSAARDAANRDEFFDAAEAVVGVRARAARRARRRAGSRSSAPPPSSTRPTARSSSSTSAAARPSSSSAPTDVRGASCRSTSAACGSPRSTSTHDPPRPEELSRCLVGRRGLPRRRACASIPAIADGARRSSAWPARSPTVAAVEIGPGRVRPRPHPPLRAHHGPRPRTCSARSPPSRSPTASTTRASSAERADVIVGGAAACSSRSCAASASTSASCREADILDGLVAQLRADGRLRARLGR